LYGEIKMETKLPTIFYIILTIGILGVIGIGILAITTTLDRIHNYQYPRQPIAIIPDKLSIEYSSDGKYWIIEGTFDNTTLEEGIPYYMPFTLPKEK